MVRKIGKLTVVLLFIQFFMASASQGLNISVLNKSGQEVTHLQVGVPYTLQIETPEQVTNASLAIPGLEHFHYQYCCSNTVILPSGSKCVHEYVIRADKQGAFRIGPIAISGQNGTILTSNARSLIVEKKEQSPVHIALQLDQQHCYLGQRVTGKIIVYMPPNIKLINIQIPQLDAARGKVKQASELMHLSKIKDGKRYEQFELSLEFIINQPGLYTIPPIEVTVAVPVNRRNSMYGYGLLYSNMKEQVFHSEDTPSIHVEALPDPSIKVHGVGVFDSFSMSVDHTNACAGEAIVVSLQLIGKDGIADVSSIPLELPSTLKYYESKTVAQSLSNGMQKKSFEYIVQVLEPGNCEIPAQSFIFFDPTKKKYRTLKTQKIALSIKGHAKKIESIDNTDTEMDSNQADAYLQLASDGPIHYYEPRSISSGYFIILLLIWLALFSLFIFKKYFFTAYASRFHYRKRVAFKIVKKKLDAVKQQKNYACLYTLFIEFFADKNGLALADIDADRINSILEEAGFMASTIEQWNRFFHELAQQAFFNNQTDKNLMLDLINRAYIWIDQFEEKL